MSTISTRGGRGLVSLTKQQANAIFTQGERGFALFFIRAGAG